MSLLDRLFGKREESPRAAPGPGKKTASIMDSKNWQRILVPAVGQPYSMRSLEVAFRLAHGSDSLLELTYVIEVPRALVLDASMPDAEAMAARVLDDAVKSARGYQVFPVATVHRARNAADGIIGLVTQDKFDLLVIGGRPDGVRGLPRDLVRELYERANCEVVLDYIAGEK